MEQLNKRIMENYKLVKDLPDDAKELPKFLASCRTLFNIINPESIEEIRVVINFLKQKLSSAIFLSFQDKTFNSLAEFENSLKSHYLRKISSLNFYINILSLKQKHGESVRSFINRLNIKKNEFLFQNNSSELNLNEILIQALTNGLEPRLSLYAQLKCEKDFDTLVKNIEEVECNMSTQSMIHEVNVANLLLGASNESVEDSINDA